jgi:hypothetical protein
VLFETLVVGWRRWQRLHQRKQDQITLAGNSPLPAPNHQASLEVMCRTKVEPHDPRPMSLLSSWFSLLLRWYHGTTMEPLNRSHGPGVASDNNLPMSAHHLAAHDTLNSLLTDTAKTGKPCRECRHSISTCGSVRWSDLCSV